MASVEPRAPRRAVRRAEHDTTDEVPGWAGGVMVALRWATRLVEVNVLVLLGTLAGGVLLGLAPAVRAASAVLAVPARDTGPTTWRDFWREWRTSWRRANLLAVPLWVVGAVLWVDLLVLRALDGPAAAALGTGLGLLTVWFVAVLAWWPRVVLRYGEDARPRATWRFLALVPLLAPGPTVAALVVVAAVVAAGLGVPLVAVLVGVSFPLWATTSLLDPRLDRIDRAAREPGTS